MLQTEIFYLVKIGPNFVGMSVIRRNDYEKITLLFVSIPKNSLSKLILYDPLVIANSYREAWQGEKIS